MVDGWSTLVYNWLRTRASPHLKSYSAQDDLTADPRDGLRPQAELSPQSACARANRAAHHANRATHHACSCTANTDHESHRARATAPLAAHSAVATRSRTATRRRPRCSRPGGCALRKWSCIIVIAPIVSIVCDHHHIIVSVF